MPTTRLASDWITVSAGTLDVTFDSLALGDGSAGAPALHGADPDSGIFFSTNNTCFTMDGANTIAFDGNGNINLRSSSSVRWTNGGNPQGTADLIVGRDAANTHGWRNGTASQTGNLYDTFTSTTDYHRLAMKTARATLSGVTGASVTATAIIPDGAVVVGVTTKVTTGLGVTGGTSGYQVGDGTDADRWGAITGTAAGTSSDNTNWTAGTIQAFTAASDIVITAVGGNFDGTGVIYVSVQYLIGQCD